MKKKMVLAHLQEAQALGSKTQGGLPVNLPSWKLEVYADMNIQTKNILDTLGVDRLCCRTVLIVNSTHDDLVYS
jgi:DNA-directed RNA polymerase subunit N (RpoN/RPB10)